MHPSLLFALPVLCAGHPSTETHLRANVALKHIARFPYFIFSSCIIYIYIFFPCSALWNVAQLLTDLTSHEYLRAFVLCKAWFGSPLTDKRAQFLLTWPEGCQHRPEVTDLALLSSYIDHVMCWLHEPSGWMGMTVWGMLALDIHAGGMLKELPTRFAPKL